MPHTLILGMTESGKTTLAKSLAQKYKSSGVKVLVLDPLSDPGWGADFQTRDAEEFLKVFWASQSCAAFIDEGGTVAGTYDKPMIETATMGRHWGHNVHYMTQRGASIARTIREQCGVLIVFETALETCRDYAKEWNRPEVIKAGDFVPGQFLIARRAQKQVRFGNVFRTS